MRPQTVRRLKNRRRVGMDLTDSPVRIRTTKESRAVLVLKCLSRRLLELITKGQAEPPSSTVFEEGPAAALNAWQSSNIAAINVLMYVLKRQLGALSPANHAGYEDAGRLKSEAPARSIRNPSSTSVERGLEGSIHAVSHVAYFLSQCQRCVQSHFLDVSFVSTYTVYHQQTRGGHGKRHGIQCRM